jgi:ribosomal protein S18 acetylase RimI-like enzyme
VSDEQPAAERPASGISARPASARADGGRAHVTVRHAKPSDYGRVIGRINVWWDGRDMAPMLPKLFFIHFEGTSFVADGEDGELLGFVCGFLSQTAADEAYIHFVGVEPGARGDGLGSALYERFFAEVRGAGRTVVRCVTSPVNERSVAFHEAMGFEVDRVVPDYDGPGEDRVLLVKRLT